mgnify:CR=1 FL=1
MDESKEISIKPSHQEIKRTLLTTLVEDPSSDFREEKWAKAVSNKELQEIIKDYEKYPTLSSLLAVLPFSAKKALFQALINELKEKNVSISTQNQKLTEILKQLAKTEIQDAIIKLYELPYWVDLDFLGDLVKALKTGAIDKEEFLKNLKEKGLSNPTVQQELTKIRGDIPKGFFPDRLAEITRERQSPQPLQQSVAEAVSNSIDAIWSKHEQERSIGQWGRGIKMLLSYLNHPQDSIVVTTTKEDETWQIEIKKGGNDRFYLRSSKIEPPSLSQKPSQESKQSGTTLILKKHQPLNQDFLEQLKGRLKKRFRFTPEVEIRINDDLINQYENLINAVTNQSMERHNSLGKVDVKLTPEEIVIEDNGGGMSPDQLLSMFIAGAGSKPFVEINDKNRESFLSLIEVFYEDKLAEKEPTAENIINFSRNRETILSLPLSSDQINLFDKPLFFELGPLLESSDAREGVKINKNFQEAVKRAVDIIIDGKTDSKQKIAILNSLVAGLTFLGGRKHGEKKTDIFTITSNIISYAHVKAQPLITDLSSQGYFFIPNYQEFSNLKLAENPNTIFIDPLLFSFIPEKQKIPGLEQIPSSIFQSSAGKKLFLADFKDETTSPIITYDEGFIINRKVWQKILTLKEENPQDFQVLVEALNLRLNPVSTSYDSYEQPLTNLQNRLVFEKEKEEEGKKQEAIEWPKWLNNKQKEELQNILKNTKEIADYEGWISTIALSPDGKRLFYAGGIGKLMVVDLENPNSQSKEIDNYGDSIETIALSPDGRQLFYGGYSEKLMMVNLQDPNLKPKKIADYGGWISTIALSPDGKRLFYGGKPYRESAEKLMVVDLENPNSQPKEIDNYGDSIETIALSPDGRQLFCGSRAGKLIMGETELVVNWENYQERLTSLTNLAEKLHTFFPYPQTIVNSLIEFFSDKKNLKINSLNQIVNWLNDEKNTTFIQNLSNLLPPEINQLNEEEKSKILTRLLTNILEISFKLSTFENSQITLPDLSAKNLLLLLNFSLINLQQDQDVLRQINQLILPEESFFQKQLYFSLVNGFFTVEKDPTKRLIFLDKLAKIKNNPSYQKYLQLIASYSEEEIINLFSKESLEKEIPGRALIEFLKKEGGIVLDEASLTELTQSLGVNEQNQSIFQRPISMAEILYQYKIKRLRNWQEVVAVINQTSATNFSLEQFRQEIIKEISGQAIEEGVARREMIQNGVDAIKNREETTKGKIDIRLFKTYDGKDEYLIEKFTDQGTGIADWLKFFIPGETTKGASDEGFFGSGAFKIFEGVDRVDIVSSADGRTAYYFRFEWQDGNLTITKSQFINNFFGQQGTAIMRIKKISDQDLPELEAGIMADDYLAFAGLLADEQINGKTVEVVINGEPIHLKKTKRLSEDFSYNDVNYGAITLVESPLPPTVAHGVGLRMSDLNERYLTYVPYELKKLIKDKKISIILPKDLPLIKDRSRIANEEELLDPLARKIAGMMIKLAAQELILGFKQRTEADASYKIWKPPGFPDDWFINPQYSKLFTGDGLEDIDTIKNIINKLNTNEVLTAEELSLLNQPFDLQSRLAMVVVGLNVNLPDGASTNLWQERLRVLESIKSQVAGEAQEKLEKLIKKEQSLISSLEITPSQIPTVSFTPENTQRQGISLVDFFLGEIKEEEVSVSKDELTDTQKQNLELLKKIASIFDIPVIPKANIGAVSYFSGNQFVIDTTVLSFNQPYCIETAFHELAHYKEGISQKHLGPIYPYLFTHQVDGPFGQAYYQVLEEVLTKYPLQSIIN